MLRWATHVARLTNSGEISKQGCVDRRSHPGCGLAWLNSQVLLRAPWRSDVGLRALRPEGEAGDGGCACRTSDQPDGRNRRAR